MTIIAHIDMDCFFCACEEKYHPELKGVPVVVGGLFERSVVSTSNYIARKYGVFSAMPTITAKRLCPNATFLNVNMQLYKEESNKVMQILKQFTNQFLQASIDEAYLDLTNFSKQFSTLEEMGLFIINKVRKETQLTCSIGIAECKIIAKIASDFNKPNGCTVVKNQEEFLAPLNVRKIPGIGKKSVKKYYDNKIYTINDLVKSDKFKLMDIGGKQAIKYQQIAKGEIKIKLEKQEERKSISTEQTFQKDTTNFHQLNKTIDEMCEQIYEGLNNIYFRTISVKIRYKNFKTITRDYSLHNGTNSIEILKEISHIMFDENYEIGNPIRLIGLKVSNFINNIHRQTRLTEFFSIGSTS
ncbi:MAG: DNA polymerase IV [Candidatus Nanoarchaeia archaeon]|nr:DNA polymerase IV [Candidatus Nanoarchaeia archaeon]